MSSHNTRKLHRNSHNFPVEFEEFYYALKELHFVKEVGLANFGASHNHGIYFAIMGYDSTRGSFRVQANGRNFQQKMYVTTERRNEGKLDEFLMDWTDRINHNPAFRNHNSRTVYRN